MHHTGGLDHVATFEADKTDDPITLLVDEPRSFRIDWQLEVLVLVAELDQTVDGGTIVLSEWPDNQHPSP